MTKPTAYLVAMLFVVAFSDMKLVHVFWVGLLAGMLD